MLIVTSFQNFQPNVSANPALSMAILLQVKQVDSTVEAGAQFQQVIKGEYKRALIQW